MHGAGSTANIFGKVKEAISDFIRSAREGDTVTLYTVDRDTTLRDHIRISGEIDKKDLPKVVEDLPSEGDRTYTGKALKVNWFLSSRTQSKRSRRLRMSTMASDHNSALSGLTPNEVVQQHSNDPNLSTLAWACLAWA